MNQAGNPWNDQEERRLFWISQGLCGRCGNEPLVQGHTLGESCLQYHRDYSSGRWMQDIANDICPKCRKRKILHGKKKCAVCLEGNAKSKRGGIVSAS